MVIDFHVHCFPDELARRAIPSLARCGGVEPATDGTLAGLRQSMKRSGIDASVVMSIATRPSQTDSITSWSKSIQAGDIFPFSSIHPASQKWREEVTIIKEGGLKGIKFHPDYQKFFVDEHFMFPIYEHIFNCGLIIVFHAGVDIGLSPPVHCTPLGLRNVVRSFRGARVVAAHSGGFRCWDDVEKYLLGEDILLDTSYSIGWMDESQAMRIINGHGHDKILFATDSPWADQGTELQKLKALKLGSEAEDAILYRNAARLLDLDILE